MKNFKMWEKRLKTTFVIRIIYILITLAGLIGIVVSQTTGTAFTETGYFIAITVAVSIFLLTQMYLMVALVRKINKYYSKISEFNEASKDPIVLNDSKSLINDVTNLDLETLATIRSLKSKAPISIEDAKATLEKTEKVLNQVKEFAEKYPTLKPTGIKDPNSLITLYNKRIVALMKSMNNA